MKKQELVEQLDRVREEIRNLPTEDGATLVALDEMVANIEREVAQDRDVSNLTESISTLREATQRFEVEHPRLTSIVNDLLVKLSAMGI